MRNIRQGKGRNHRRAGHEILVEGANLSPYHPYNSIA